MRTILLLRQGRFIRRYRVARELLARWLLSLAIVVAPAGGFAHALSHLDTAQSHAGSADDHHDDDATELAGACGLCLAYTAADSAASADALPMASDYPRVANPTVVSRAAPAALAPHPTARDPPRAVC